MLRIVRKEFKKLTKKFGITVDIEYETPTGMGGWGEQGIPGKYEEIKCLYDVTDDLNVKKYPYAEVTSGKSLFFVPLEYDLRGKDNIRIIWNGQIINIKKATPYQPIGDEFLCQLLIQE